MNIIIDNIKKDFEGKKVLKKIDMKIESKKSTIILGKSGCGKSVLLKIIYQLISQDFGSIYYNLENKVDINKFAMLFQYGALFDSLKIWENISFQELNTKKIKKDELKDQVVDIMESLGLSSDNLYKYPSELSGGMKKRVALGRALFKKPEVIFLDEPTTGLDPINSELINELIIKTVKEKKITAVTITHDIRSAIKTGDKFYYLEDGVIETENYCKNLYETDNSKLQYFLKGERPFK
jgi:phospholipid/cholesterol/gamma-HCH transport system ATP-binding protein|tara:strand:+ start:1011 stop:1724 length:714 start_codon:yes stop_codon:yes gene_type:complete